MNQWGRRYILKKILIVLTCVVNLFTFTSCVNDGLSERSLDVVGATADVQFKIGNRYGIIFNNTDIVIDDNVVIDGNCVANHVEYGIDGFADQDDVKGYFLPLEIQNKEVNESYEIDAKLMGKDVLADILKSGKKYYAVIRLIEGGGGFDFNHGILEIAIMGKAARFSLELELIQRIDTAEGTPGLCLNPVIAGPDSF